MMPSDHGSRLGELRDVVGEIEALSTLLLHAFDHADWRGANQLLVERTAYVIGIIARNAATAASRLDGLHVAVADTQPVPVGEQWVNKGTASAPGEAHDAEIVRRLRERCAAKFRRPVGYPFFIESYLDGEDPDTALLRLFRRNQQVLGWTDDDVIAAMVPHAVAPNKPSDHGGSR